MIKQIKNSLKELGFNNNEVKIYVALTQLGEATAAQIAKQSDLPRTTTISILNKMRDENYLTIHKYRGTTYYWIESPKTLASALEQKQAVAENLGNMLADLYRTQSTFPSAQVFDTKSGIKNFISKTIAEMDNKSTIYTIDTPEVGNYAKIYPDNIYNLFLAQKKKKQIQTKTLITFGTYNKIKPDKLKQQDIEIREMPEEIKFQASLWLTKNQLVHFSGMPPFIVCIKHEIIVTSIKSLYNYLWGISEQR
ncbi:MAG: helix-turn-helix domain-containing protein [Candidatus Uhrbacteria bacterium]